MSIADFEDARRAVAAGTSADVAAARLVAAMTPDERLGCLDGDWPAWAGVGFLGDGGYHRAPIPAARVERLGFPGFSFGDGPRGSVIGDATCFPVSMARGATWDPELEERVGEVVGRELRAAGATFSGSVCVNLLRHPAWGRAQETYGEDPHHVGEMGAAFTRGLQRHVLACVKHLACNSMEEARFTVDVEVDEVALHEVYLPHFRRVVDEGVASVMAAYNAVDGEWCGQHRQLLTEVLRDEWGFEGFTISDFIFGIRDAAGSLRAGLDVEMPFRMVRAERLRAELDGGSASWDEVDLAVRRGVATLLRFDDVLSAPAPERTLVGCDEHAALAREVAARSVVLLRNEAVGGTPVLPLAADTRVAVLGRLAAEVNVGDGGSSDVWDLDCEPVLEGLRSTFGAGQVTHDDGSDLERAARTAAAADVALVVVGFTHLDEGEFIGGSDPALAALFPAADDPNEVARFEQELAALPATTVPARLTARPPGFSTGGDRAHLGLHPEDVALIQAVLAANPRTVVAVQAGSAVLDEHDEWVEAVPALVQAWYGGARAGSGLADVLFGVVEPSARLPFSVPRHADHLPPFDRHATSVRYDRWHGWWHLARQGHEPRFPFGFGLTYSRLERSSAAVAVRAADGSAPAALHVRATVQNHGDRHGTEVVQVYASLPDPAAPDRLVAFARVPVPAGSTAEGELLVPLERLATRDPVTHTWRPAMGEHRISVGLHAGDPGASTTTLVL